MLGNKHIGFSSTSSLSEFIVATYKMDSLVSLIILLYHCLMELKIEINHATIKTHDNSLLQFSLVPGNRVCLDKLICGKLNEVCKSNYTINLVVLSKHQIKLFPQ